MFKFINVMKFFYQLFVIFFDFLSHDYFLKSKIKLYICNIKTSNKLHSNG